MSGPFGSQQWMYSSGFYPHEIGNSARFDTNSYISRTPSSAGNRKTFTWSAWVKRCKFSVIQTFFSVGSSNSSLPRVDWQFIADDTLQLYFNPTGSTWIRGITTNASYRDPSAWYHVVAAIDTTQAAGSNRVKLYVNGEQITAFTFGAYLTQDSDMPINNTVEHNIGRYQSDANAYFDGYIAEVNFVDGQALDASYFGETKSDTWIPKKYTGSYGTNGYYLDYATRATDPIDASPNGNNWSSTNVVATDWMLDSPTNNFATLNPLGPRINGANHGMGTLTQGNLTVSSTSGSYYSKTSSTIYNHASTGKWYYEIRMDSLDFGSSSGYVQFNIGGNYVWRYYGNSNTLINTGGSFTSLANGDILMFAVDQDNGKGYFGVNGSWYNHSGAPDPAAGTNPHATFGTLSAYGIIGHVEIRSGSAVNTVTANFGQDSSFAGQATAQGNTDANGRGDFYYSPPAGFLALCSANMPDPATAINPAANNSPQDHFNTVLYTGNSGTQSITGVGFQPDWIWVKKRSAGGSHNLVDAVRGADKLMFLEYISSAELTFTGGIGSFDSDGFSLASSDSGYNASGVTYVAWNWKANGSGSSNSDGTISSTVSANTDSGFSIVTYDGSSAGTVGHGLSSTPEIVIQKPRNTTDDYWWFGTTVIDGSVDYFQWDANAAKADSGYTAPTSSVFSNVTFTGATSNIAYCFHSVEGFSKFGKYTGNGNADGPFIHCGFKPAWVLLKNANDAEWWTLVDNKRLGYNETNSVLSTNSSNAEYSNSGGGFDLVSNGFKVRGTSNNFNGSSDTILYMAFAEMPFKYANAR